MPFVSNFTNPVYNPTTTSLENVHHSASHSPDSNKITDNLEKAGNSPYSLWKVISNPFHSSEKKTYELVEVRSDSPGNPKEKLLQQNIVSDEDNKPQKSMLSLTSHIMLGISAGSLILAGGYLLYHYLVSVTGEQPVALALDGLTTPSETRENLFPTFVFNYEAQDVDYSNPDRVQPLSSDNFPDYKFDYAAGGIYKGY